MPFSTSVCRTAAVRKVEGACRLSCSCGPGQWPGRDVDRQENGAEGPAAFGSGGQNHPWAGAGPVVARTVCSSSNHTRPMSWLGPASSGAHPRTKGARFCTGGHRHRLPLTTKGLPVARAAWQATGGPFAEAGEMQINRTRRRRFAEKLPSGPAAGDGWAGRAHGSRRRCALGVPQGMRRSAGQGAIAAMKGGHCFMGNGVGQEPLRPLRRGREAPRLDVPDSTGSVPLQSG